MFIILLFAYSRELEKKDFIICLCLCCRRDWFCHFCIFSRRFRHHFPVCHSGFCLLCIAVEPGSSSLVCLVNKFFVRHKIILFYTNERCNSFYINHKVPHKNYQVLNLFITDSQISAKVLAQYSLISLPSCNSLCKCTKFLKSLTILI